MVTNTKMVRVGGEAGMGRDEYESARYPGGFGELFQNMASAFEWRSAFTFPEDAMFRVKSEKIGSAIRKILLPLAEPKPVKNEYFRVIKRENGNIACEGLPTNRLVFEIDSKWRLVAGTGVPMEIYEKFVKRR